MEFKIDDKFIRLMNWHVSQDTHDSYQLMCESEWEEMRSHVESPGRVLDLGCGLGRMSIYVNWMLGNDDTHWILADSTNPAPRPKFGWKPSKGYYNDLKLTEEFVSLNGLTNFETFDLEAQDLSSLSDVDLVMSFLSVGFHYPIEDYLQTLLDITTDDCVMIFGVRVGQHEEQTMARYFCEVSLRHQSGIIDTKEDVLILSGKKCSFDTHN